MLGKLRRSQLIRILNGERLPSSVTARPRLEVRMLVWALKLQLTGPGNLVGDLKALLTQKWAASVVNRQTSLSTSEAGDSLTFTFKRTHTPEERAFMAEDAFELGDMLDDPENPQMGVVRYCAPNRHPDVQCSGTPPVSRGPKTLPAVEGGV